MDKYAGGVAKYRAAEGKEVLVPLPRAGAPRLRRKSWAACARHAPTSARAGFRELSKRTTFVRVTQQLNEVFGKELNVDSNRRAVVMVRSIARGAGFHPPSDACVSRQFPSDLISSAPSFKAGDHWEFEGTENGKPYVFSREVSNCCLMALMRVRAIENGKESEEVYDGAMNALVGGRADRVRELAKYPMVTK